MKRIVLIGVLIIYAGYYAGVSKGLIKKHITSDQEERSFIGQVIDFITPKNPEEQRAELNEQLENWKLHLAVAQENLANYEKWRSNVISNPPT
jgi:hypothetical protein